MTITDIIMVGILLGVAPILLITLFVQLIRKKPVKWVLIGLALSVLIFLGTNELSYLVNANKGIKEIEATFNSTNLKEMDGEAIRSELVSAEFYCFDLLDGSTSLEEKLFQRAEPIIYAYVDELGSRGDGLSDGVVVNLLSNLEDATEDYENAQKLYDAVQNRRR